jgi:hypothetical protein
MYFRHKNIKYSLRNKNRYKEERNNCFCFNILYSIQKNNWNNNTKKISYNGGRRWLIAAAAKVGLMLLWPARRRPVIAPVRADHRLGGVECGHWLAAGVLIVLRCRGFCIDV